MVFFFEKCSLNDVTPVNKITSVNNKAMKPRELNEMLFFDKFFVKYAYLLNSHKIGNNFAIIQNRITKIMP